MKWLIVENLAPTVSKKDLRALLENVGEVKTFSHLGYFARCQFVDAETASVAEEALHGIEFHDRELDVHFEGVQKRPSSDEDAKQDQKRPLPEPDAEQDPAMDDEFSELLKGPFFQPHTVNATDCKQTHKRPRLEQGSRESTKHVTPGAAMPLSAESNAHAQQSVTRQSVTQLPSRPKMSTRPSHHMIPRQPAGPPPKGPAAMPPRKTVNSNLSVPLAPVGLQRHVPIPSIKPTRAPHLQSCGWK
eukprot:TRINITY_DN58281_c0_g1_i1.p1 TRINITY_DN58281_c0_g1~~TRINITY_DN58281_c0_g1_i1.p1  ORF type:complete len:245 (-),score=40.42 TRINITY_DN58281_c0_g1_i1:246-980(-)